MARPPPIDFLRIVAAFSATAMMVYGAELQPASAAPSVTASSSPVAPPAGAGSAGASNDVAAIAEAAEEYSSADPMSAADLAEAASEGDEVSLQKTKTGMVAQARSGSSVEVTSDGDVTISTPGLPEIGLSVAGDLGQVHLVDGALVQSAVAPSTDVVTRATDNGVQMVAVLGDQSAPTTVAFPLALPERARLLLQPDGSVQIIANVTTEVALPGEEERVALGIKQVLDGPTGSVTDVDEITASQWEAISRIPSAETISTSQPTVIAEIATPWAVDANGAPLSTHYVIEQNTLAQVVDVDDNTAFPVVADPDIWWYLVKAAGCLVSVAGIVFVAAKVAQVSLKVFNLLRAAKSGTSLARAYVAWLRLGASNGERLSNALNAMRTAASLVKDVGIARAKEQIAKKGGQLAASMTLLYEGAKALTDVTGLGDCVSLFTGKDY